MTWILHTLPYLYVRFRWAFVNLTLIRQFQSRSLKSMSVRSSMVISSSPMLSSGNWNSVRFFNPLLFLLLYLGYFISKLAISYFCLKQVLKGYLHFMNIAQPKTHTKNNKLCPYSPVSCLVAEDEPVSLGPYCFITSNKFSISSWKAILIYI